MNTNLDTLVVKCHDTLCDQVDDEIVAMNIDNGAFYGLNVVGTEIIKFIDQPRRVREIRDHLLMRYAVDAETCERQLLSLLDELLAENLIECESGDTGSKNTSA
eukprot:TRINITY_DN50077_c0_g1_i1.p2 TRINITY_DN50077_c0_g1~~TRINITY_DN50077_c0_g1_i1.p2  ORF type:complete len:104 (-),score=21.19 TRINITY_DN50077_c0_g1_i1:218-529(-)